MHEQPKQPQDRHRSTTRLSGIGAAEIQRYMRDLEYPADKSQLLEQARKEHAPQNVLDVIEEFPDQHYNSAVHVSQMLDRLHH